VNETPTGYLAIREGGAFADLSARTKVRLTGADRVRYLNGQVTANVTALGSGRSLAACITNAKGKLSADIVITAHADALLIDAEPEVRESLQPRLEKYIIADDVIAEDVTDDLALFHVFAATLPEGAPAASEVAGSRRYGVDGWDIVAPAASAEVVALWLGQTFTLVGDQILETVRVERGVPRWGRELGEDTLPPEAGLDRTHINYHKGCYIGQEVISRLKSVGHVNRQLTGFESVDTAATLAPEMRLFAPEAPERQIGTLTSAVWSFALAKPIALGYLKRGSPTGELIALPPHADTPVVRVTARELPFIP
jgi:folate-binding protein YgfZ